MTADCELLVVGAGPAGMAAAVAAARHGVEVVLVDEQAAPGGQIYRSITTTPLRDRSVLGRDYWYGEALVEALTGSPVHYEPSTTVWALSRLGGVSDKSLFEVACSSGGQTRIVRTQRILLATGALERPFPFSGWTLPGVMTAGAAQIALKTAGMAPSDRTVLAGTGPLLYQLVWQYMNAGVMVDLILDTTPRGRMRAALPYAWDFIRSPYFSKGRRLLRAVRTSAQIVRHVTSLTALGKKKLGRVRYTAHRYSHTARADHLIVHQGIVPNINLSRAAGLELRWNDLQACWAPDVDEWGGSSQPGIMVAGDGAGGAGALVAELRGRLAGLHAAYCLGRLSESQRDADAVALKAALASAIRGRDFIDAMYLPSESFRRPTDETVVCRCEEVTAAQIRDSVRLGCSGPNQVKAFTRCGMGPCQGRYCGLTVAEIIAQTRGVPVPDVGYYRLRYPTKPLALDELAALPQTEESKHAVVRSA
ncbi:MAG: FAD-dependent oxidoreductase [Candidimonas sp.]|nr:MAG: FAD-dependent oxidoreductase [Candidimonas sp.]